jgi:hypothetical protein
MLAIISGKKILIHLYIWFNNKKCWTIYRCIIITILNSRYLLSADDLKIYRTVTNVDDCKLLQHDINSVHNWCLANGMKINIGKTTIISFRRKTNSILFNYKLCNNLVARSQCVKDLGVLLDYKLYFHQHVHCILSQGLRMLGLIRYITSSFSTLESLLVSYSSLVRSKLENTLVVWNSVTSTDSSNLKEFKENLQRYVTPDSLATQVHLLVEMRTFSWIKPPSSPHEEEASWCCFSN